MLNTRRLRALCPTLFDTTNTLGILAYQPTYSFKDLLADLAEYGPKGPPLPEF
ncbi:hypothetical protein [Pelolinea submarina]|uniref:hypothetical protein n=1 Tax=Pelolinea submarina TaxID=913107 RepID=UPI000E29F397|nr:hypothetical protein [Pelolinea submarina]BBB47215.1 hypothetical protein Pelsub_P0442 [Pelolinea submarina]